jgi:hypothetical protein
MCTSQPDPAKDARRREEERQRKIAAGRSSIDEQFSQFTPDYYNTAQNDYLSYYNPQVTDQFDKARKNLIYMLSDNGNLNASSGANLLSELQKERANQEAQLASNASGFTNQIRGNVESAKNQLYAQNSSAADPSAAAQSAINQAQLLSAPPVYNPIGDLFGQFINQAATRVRATKASDQSFTTPILFNGGYGGSGGSSRVVS